MSFLEQLHKRQAQKKANDFIHSLEGKSLKYIEQAYLDNRELANNEIVLSYLFFKHPELIRILPRKFQKSRLNSNVNMFRYGSNEAKREIGFNELNEYEPLLLFYESTGNNRWI